MAGPALFTGFERGLVFPVIGFDLLVCDLDPVQFGIVKTATVSFGQAMPVAEMQIAERETLACDLFIAIGSSLVVYPAAGFPELAKRNNARLVIINRDPTPLDGIADLVLPS